jgi:hypothetical protein
MASNDSDNDDETEYDDDVSKSLFKATDGDTPDDVVVVNQGYSIFDDDMIDKYTDPAGKPRWRCMWCDNSFAGWNATKAVAHVNKLLKTDIKPCKVRIDDEHTKKYATFLKQLEKKRTRLHQCNEAIDRSVTSHNHVTASTLETRKSSSSFSLSSKRSKKSNDNTGNTTLSSTKTPPGNLFLIILNFFKLFLTKMFSFSYTGIDKTFVQLRLLEGAKNPTAESKLTMAIADMIHSLGLPFSLASEKKFKHVLNLARTVGNKYEPPDRNSVSGELLDLNYNEYIKKNLVLLQKDIEIFGLTFFGDGATIKKTPLINILASGVHKSVAVLEIADCSKQAGMGNKKDSRYIASLFRPHIDSMETDFPNTTDVLFFDGAANVQTAGAVIEAKYPRAITLHGAEHVVSLFFSDIFSFPECNALYQIAKRAYRVFGSGSMHQPYAIFQKYSKRHNEGRNIGLMRAAGTRMAGAAIVLIRFIRLRDALISTVTSPEFLKLKVSKLDLSIVVDLYFLTIFFILFLPN